MRTLILWVGLVFGMASGLWGQHAGFRAEAQESIVPEGAEWEKVWGEGVFTEGPAPAPDGSIYFSDIGVRVYRFDPKTRKTSIFREPSGRANGMMFTREGALVVCEGSWGGNLRMSVTDAGKREARVLADRFEGKRLNSPNDVVVTPGGRIYFTDPRYRGDEVQELDFEGVFFVDGIGAAKGAKPVVKLATKEVVKPNGIVISPDGKTVYVADAPRPGEGRAKLLAFAVKEDGSFGEKREFFDFGEGQRGLDGMTVDVKGNVYGAGGKDGTVGVYVFSAEGKQVAFLPLPGFPTNCVFGVGAESKVLYATAQCGKGTPKITTERGTGEPFGLFRMPLKVEGYHPALAEVGR